MNQRTEPIEHVADAEEWFKYLSGQERFALDLEADGFFSYEDKICLSQFATLDECALVDPLKERDCLAGLGPLLADGRIEKIFHGGDYDIRLLKKDYGFKVENLFDTMIAAQLLGREKLGLAALLEDHFSVLADKKYQRADWSKRPLEADMLDYAATDVLHLVELRDILADELEKLGRMGWAREEFALMAAIEPAPPKKPWCLDVKGAGKLPPRVLAVLQGLLELRDETARAWNKPHFKVISNNVLIEWAKKPPRNRNEVINTKGAGRGALAKLASGILKAVEHALALPDDQLPQKPKGAPRYIPTDEEKAKLTNLKAARDEVCAALGINGGLVANAATLGRLSTASPDTALEEARSLFKGWQWEVLGDSITKVLTK
jgi:ribonuclease D